MRSSRRIAFMRRTGSSRFPRRRSRKRFRLWASTLGSIIAGSANRRHAGSVLNIECSDDETLADARLSCLVRSVAETASRRRRFQTAAPWFRFTERFGMVRSPSRLPNSAASGRMRSVRTFLISLAAGLLVWIAICLVAIAYEPSHVGSLVATLEIVVALVLAIVACLLLRLR